MSKSTTGAGRKPAPLTTAQKQSRRRAALDEIAQAHGWDSWNQYATAVKCGIIIITTKSRANSRKGGCPRKTSQLTTHPNL